MSVGISSAGNRIPHAGGNGTAFRFPMPLHSVVRYAATVLAGVFLVALLLRSASAADVYIGADWARPMTFLPYRDLLSNEIDSVYAIGKIVDGSTRALQAVLDKYQVKAGSTVYFHSPGGRVDEGMAIGRLIRARSLGTSIGQPRRASTPATSIWDVASHSEAGECDSACSLAFLGGIHRSIVDGSLYGVHDAALEDPSSVKNPFASGQVAAAAESLYYSEMGVDPRLLGLKNQFDSSANQLAYLTPGLMARLRVITPGLQTTWEFTPEGDREVVLLGKTADGAGNFNVLVFRCNDLFADLPRRPELIARYRLPTKDMWGKPLLPKTFAAGVTGLGWENGAISRIGPGPGSITIAPTEVAFPAHIVLADQIWVGITLTPRLVEYLRSANDLYFSFHGPSGDSVGFSSDVGSSRSRILDFVANCH